MHRWIIPFILSFVLLGFVSCTVNKEQKMSKDAWQTSASSANVSTISGVWVRYVPNGEWGAALEVYDFLPNGRYRIIIGVLPEMGRQDALPTALALTGRFTLQGDVIAFVTDDGAGKGCRFEIHDDCLLLKEKNDKITILRRVAGSDAPAPHAVRQ
ncbi:MAG: hypothetical protein ACOX5G_01095 [Kiritimatiellia bacterium]|jgi:hypothetical protein